MRIKYIFLTAILFTILFPKIGLAYTNFEPNEECFLQEFSISDSVDCLNNLINQQLASIENKLPEEVFKKLAENLHSLKKYFAVSFLDDSDSAYLMRNLEIIDTWSLTLRKLDLFINKLSQNNIKNNEFNQLKAYEIRRFHLYNQWFNLITKAYNFSIGYPQYKELIDCFKTFTNKAISNLESSQLNPLFSLIYLNLVNNIHESIIVRYQSMFFMWLDLGENSEFKFDKEDFELSTLCSNLEMDVQECKSEEIKNLNSKLDTITELIIFISKNEIDKSEYKITFELNADNYALYNYLYQVLRLWVYRYLPDLKKELNKFIEKSENEIQT